jgi:acetyl-CoA acetyltransferase
MCYEAEIPYGAYWCTPFARWQGSFANLHALEFAAHTARQELARRNIPSDAIEHGVLGFSVPQKHSFFGMPWVAGMAGFGHVGGQVVMQACATGVRALLAAVQEIDAGLCKTSIAVTCDRTSNGPHLYYPNPRGPGGTGAHEDWVMDNFSNDPLGCHSMIRTAENVAAKHQITTAEQHEVVLKREAQYRDALADDCAFQKRYITLPFPVPDPSYRKTVATLASDEGINFSNAEGPPSSNRWSRAALSLSAGRPIPPTAMARSSLRCPTRRRNSAATRISACVSPASAPSVRPLPICPRRRFRRRATRSIRPASRSTT